MHSLASIVYKNLGVSSNSSQAVCLKRNIDLVADSTCLDCFINRVFEEIRFDSKCFRYFPQRIRLRSANKKLYYTINLVYTYVTKIKVKS